MEDYFVTSLRTMDFTTSTSSLSSLLLLILLFVIQPHNCLHNHCPSENDSEDIQIWHAIPQFPFEPFSFNLTEFLSTASKCHPKRRKVNNVL